MKSKRALCAIAATATMMTIVVANASAAKGGSGKPPKNPTAAPVPVDDGVIYHEDAISKLSFINSDGTGALSTTRDRGAYPSREQHGGKRWLLSIEADPDGGSYPDGSGRLQVFARSMDTSGNLANAVPLVADADMQMDSFGVVRWVADAATGEPDVHVSWVGRLWDTTVSPPVVAQAGIYAAEVQYDPSTDDVVGLVAQPTEPAVPFVLTAGSFSNCNLDDYRFADVHIFNWRPDGAYVVYSQCTDSQILVVDLDDPSQHDPLGVNGGWADWSPDLDPATQGYESKIVYASWPDIRTISPDGSEETTVVEGRARSKGKRPRVTYERPYWSPTGSHITYGKIEDTIDAGVYIAATGGDQTRLTDGGRPWGWVSAPAP